LSRGRKKRKKKCGVGLHLLLQRKKKGDETSPPPGDGGERREKGPQV